MTKAERIEEISKLIYKFGCSCVDGTESWVDKGDLNDVVDAISNHIKDDDPQPLVGYAKKVNDAITKNYVEHIIGVKQERK